MRRRLNFRFVHVSLLLLVCYRLQLALPRISGRSWQELPFALPRLPASRRATLCIFGALVQPPVGDAAASANGLWGSRKRFTDWDTSGVLARLLSAYDVKSVTDLPERVQLAYQVWSLALSYAVDLPDLLDTKADGRAWWEGVLVDASKSADDGPAAVRLVMDSLRDRFARYISAEDWGQQELIYAGQPAIGFGVAFVLAPTREGSISRKPLQPGPEVLFVLPGSVAEAAGVQRGDVLVEIDGNPIGRDTDPDRFIFGPINSTANVTLLRPASGKLRSYTLPRIPTQVQAVEAASFGPSVGYISISTFQPPLRADLEKAVQTALFQPQPAAGSVGGEAATGNAGLVIDLRGNGGGRITEADAAAAVLVKASRSLRVPVVVLVDDATASAAEALAVALREQVSAKIMGAGSWQTLGKGEEQVPFELFDGSAVLLSVDRWAPRGFKGITADKVCEDGFGLPGAASAKADPCVAASLDMLRT